MDSLIRQIKLAFGLIVAVVLLGTFGYRIVGLSWLDALYQTMITITTVGYSDLTPDGARPFTIIMVAVGTLTLAVFISVITGGLVEAQLQPYFGRRKVEGKVRKLTNHVILCGFGRFGRITAAELKRRGTPFVVIEKDSDKCDVAREHGYLVIPHDATEEEALSEAGFELCQGLLSTLGTDADNVYVTLTAKQLKRSVRVVAIAQDERAKSKLEAAGADEVVSPYQLGGNWMAQAITAPAVSDFMKTATGRDFEMGEQVLSAESSLCGLQLKETPIRSELGVTVVAVRRKGGKLEMNPSPDMRLDEGDVLVSIGAPGDLARLRALAAGGS